MAQETDIPAPTAADVAYGSHERQVLDLWRAEASEPRPLAVMIHGGGWRGGEKFGQIVKWGWKTFNKLRAAQIHVASINYRYLSPQSPLPAPLDDAARAVQFLRCHAATWGIDRDRVAAFGASAGGCSVLWLAFHEDLADPESSDVVERESTRLTCAVAVGAQTSIYPAQLRDWIGPLAEKHGMVAGAFGHESVEAAYEAGCEPLYLRHSPYTHLREDASPVFLDYATYDPEWPAKDIGHAIHHPRFGIRLKQAMDALGVECWLDVAGPQRCVAEQYDHHADFLIDKLSTGRPDRRCGWRYDHGGLDVSSVTSAQIAQESSVFTSRGLVLTEH